MNKKLDPLIVQKCLENYNKVIKGAKFKRIKNIIINHDFEIYSENNGRYFVQCIKCKQSTWFSDDEIKYSKYDVAKILKDFEVSLTCDEMAIKDIIE